MQMKDKRHPLCAKDYMCQSSSPKLPMAVDTALGWQLPVVIATSPGLRKLGELLWLERFEAESVISLQRIT